MVNHYAKFILILMMAFSLSLVSIPQATAQSTPAAGSTNTKPGGGPRKQLATILFAGPGRSHIRAEYTQLLRPGPKTNSQILRLALRSESSSELQSWTYRAANEPARALRPWLPFASLITQVAALALSPTQINRLHLEPTGHSNFKFSD